MRRFNLKSDYKKKTFAKGLFYNRKSHETKNYSFFSFILR